MALSQGKKTQSRASKQFSFGVVPGAVIFQGALVMLFSGAARPAGALGVAADAAKCVVVGVAERPATGAADGSTKVSVIAETYLLKNSTGADAITAAAIGQPAYAVDDETVALTSANNLRPRAGTIVDVESIGVWVRTGV